MQELAGYGGSVPEAVRAVTTATENGLEDAHDAPASQFANWQLAPPSEQAILMSECDPCKAARLQLLKYPLHIAFGVMPVQLTDPTCRARAFLTIHVPCFTPRSLHFC